MRSIIINLCLLFMIITLVRCDHHHENNNNTSKLLAKSPSPPSSSSLISPKPISNTLANNIHGTIPSIEENIIRDSSDYVPVKEKKQHKILNSTVIPTIQSKAASSPSSNNITTNSNANVYEAVPSTGKDPMQTNAQQQNPFLSGGGGLGGLNPQIAMILRNNPRLQMLARQNPVIAQQIMRNPQLLRDPMIQRAIQSQLNPGQQQNLLGQIGQLGLRGLNGLGQVINPLGLNPLNPLQRGAGGGRGLNNNPNNNLLNNNGMMNRNPLHNNRLNHQQDQDMRNFGLPQHRQHNNFNRQHNPHQDTLNGGYYGDNENYSNPPVENNEIGDEGAHNPEEENGGDPGQQDYEGNGEDNGGEGGGEEQQNPADDPDIQQLQNFGGPINDNFPEGLFPPGLLTKEDLEEIRRQQEKQQREAEERERQQQQNQQESSSPDYEDVTTNDGGQGEGTGEENQGVEYPESGEEINGSPEQNQGTEEHNAANVDHQDQNNNQIEDHAAYTTPAPPAFRNAYQPIQPGHHNGQINHHQGNEYQQVQHHPGSRNQFNFEPKVEYDDLPHQNGFMTSTISPLQDDHYNHHKMPYSSHHDFNNRNHHRMTPHHHHHHHHHQYPPRPKISQWTSGVGTQNQVNNFPRAPLYQDDEASPEFPLTTPRTTYSNILNNNHYQHGRAKPIPRPRPRIFH